MYPRAQCKKPTTSTSCFSQQGRINATISNMLLPAAVRDTNDSLPCFLILRVVRTRSRNALLKKMHFEFTKLLVKLKGRLKALTRQQFPPAKLVCLVEFEVNLCFCWLHLNSGAGFDVQYRKPDTPAGEPRKMKRQNPKLTPVPRHFFPRGTGEVSRERHRQ